MALRTKEPLKHGNLVIFSLVSKIYVILSTVVIIALSFKSEAIFRIILTEEYNNPSYLFNILIYHPCLYGFYLLCSVGIWKEEKTSIIFYVTFLASILSLVLNLFIVNIETTSPEIYVACCVIGIDIFWLAALRQQGNKFLKVNLLTSPYYVLLILTMCLSIINLINEHTLFIFLVTAYGLFVIYLLRNLLIEVKIYRAKL